MALHFFDWFVIVGYAAFAVGVGVFFSRRASQGPDEFFLSGRSLPWWLTGTSMVATSFAADTPLLISGWVRDHGIWMNWQWWCFAVGGLLTTFIFARYWRRGEVMTVAELAELRYGGREAEVLRGSLGVVHALFLNTWVLGWVMLAAQKILGVLFELGEIEALAVACALSLSYSLLAGFWGVVVTDIIQFSMAMAGAICFAFIAWGAVGGLAEVETAVAGLGESGSNILRLVPPAGEGYSVFEAGFWTVPFAAFAVLIGVQWWATSSIDGGPTVVQRIAASRTPRDGMLGALWYNVAHYALRPWSWIAVGLASLVVLPSVLIEAPADGRITAFTDARRVPVTLSIPNADSEAEPVTVTRASLGLPESLPEGKAAHFDWSPQSGRVTATLVDRADPIGSLVVVSGDGTKHVVPLEGFENWGSGAPGLPDDLLGKPVSVGDTIVRTDSERVYVVMMLRYLPVGLLGLVAASLMAAFMSTIDTHVNLAASYYVNDIHRRFFAPATSGKKLVVVARIASATVLFLGALFAALSDSIAGLFQFFLAFLGGVGPAYLLRWLWWRVTARVELVAMATSIVATIFLSWGGLQAFLLGSELTWPLSALTPDGNLSHPAKVLIVVSLSLSASLLTILFSRPRDPASLVPFYEKVRPIGAWGPVRALATRHPPPGEVRTSLIGIASGLALTYGLMFAIGCAILGRWNVVIIGAVIVVPATVGVTYACRVLGAREESLERERPPPSE